VLKKRFKTESNVRDATRWPLRYYTRFLPFPIIGVAVICAEWFRFHFVYSRPVAKCENLYPERFLAPGTPDCRYAANRGSRTDRNDTGRNCYEKYTLI